MKFLTLEYIKAHSRIDYDCEDGLLELYGTAAESVLAQHLGRCKTVDDMVESLTDEFGEVPASILQAGLMLVDTSYQYRSPVSQTSLYAVPYTFEFLVRPYMIL